MTSRYPLVPLGEILALDLDQVSVDTSATYKMVGVYSFGRGLFRREPVEGNRTSYRHFYRLHSRHIVMSQLFGWEGALALSSEEFSGEFVSPQFPTFVCDEFRLNRQFLGWAMRQPGFWADLGTRTSGMGDRRRTLTPDSLFQSAIPLPPIDEQRRISAKLHVIEEGVTRARLLKQSVNVQLSEFIASAHVQSSRGRTVRMAEMLSLKEVRLPVESGQSYPQVGIRGFGGGLFAKAAVSLSETTYRFFHLLHEDDFVVSQVKGWEGAVAVCDRTYAGLFASPEYRTFACNPDMLNPRYWSFIVRTEWFQGFLKQLSRGQGARRERLRPEMLLNLDLPVPRLADQLRLLPTFELVERLRSEDITEELDAILPAALDSALNGRL